MRNLSYENEYDLHSNGLVSKTHFHMKGFALGLVLKQRQKTTRKWPISLPKVYHAVQTDVPRDAFVKASWPVCYSEDGEKIRRCRSLFENSL